jgi:hypothetical protein
MARLPVVWEGDYPMSILLWVWNHLARLMSIFVVVGLALLTLHQLGATPSQEIITLEDVLGTVGIISLCWVLGFLAAWEWAIRGEDE